MKEVRESPQNLPQVFSPVGGDGNRTREPRMLYGSKTIILYVLTQDLQMDDHHIIKG